MKIEFAPEVVPFIEEGRLQVLRSFDDMCAADGMTGFTSEEWSAVKKFFAWNKQISGWDK